MKSFDDSVKVVRLFQEVMQLFRQIRSNVFDETGITIPQSMVLDILIKEKTIKLTELSKRLSLSTSTASGIVDRLEKQGIVERKRSDQDKRIVFISLAPDFINQTYHKNYHKLLKNNVENVISKGTPEELNKIVEGLEILKKLISNQTT